MPQGVHVPAATIPGASVVSCSVQNDGCFVPKHCCGQCSGAHVHAPGLPHGRICHHEAEHPTMGRLDVLGLPHAGATPLSA